MKKLLPWILGAAALASLAIALLLPFPHRAEGLYVPTVYLPGGTFLLPVKLDDHKSVNGLRRLEDVRVRIESDSTPPLQAEGVPFEGQNHNDTWGGIRVPRSQDPTRTMPYAYLKVSLPTGDEWRGTQITIHADATLVYPEYSVSPELEAGYVDQQKPIAPGYSLKIATREEEQDAKDKKAAWDRADQEWNVRYDRWVTMQITGYICAGVLLVASIAAFFLARRSA